jgi:ComF family protein
VCERDAEYFCPECQDKIDFLYFQPRFKPLEGLIDDIHILGFFTPPLSTVIKSLKYQSLSPIGSILGDLLYKHLPLSTNIDCVTAVPLHPKRFRQRGYNQAELIARQLANQLDKPYQPLILRQRHTQNLASATTDEERFKLIDQAFSLNPSFQSNIRGKNILLIDDVVTTGSTIAACATQLKQAGAAQIFAAAVAHEG